MLQSYLKSLDATTIVVVSHDRAFLDAVANEIIVFRHKRLAYHVGNYSGASGSHGCQLWSIKAILASTYRS